MPHDGLFGGSGRRGVEHVGTLHGGGGRRCGEEVHEIVGKDTNSIHPLVPLQQEIVG